MNISTQIRKAFRQYLKSGNHTLMWELSKLSNELGYAVIEIKESGDKTCLFGKKSNDFSMGTDGTVLASLGKEYDNVKSIW